MKSESAGAAEDVEEMKLSITWWRWMEANRVGAGRNGSRPVLPSHT